MPNARTRKRLWTEYNKLKNWAASTESGPKQFVDDTPILDEMTTPSDSINQTIQEHDGISIVGLIFPSAEPFRQLGLKIEIQVPAAYPQVPPQVFMRMDIRHPNIEKDGKICSNLLSDTRRWEESVSLIDIVKIIIDLMDKPETNHMVDLDMGALYLSSPNEYNQKIREMVSRQGVRRA